MNMNGCTGITRSLWEAHHIGVLSRMYNML
jgi:hypothetical protein